ncbi:MAG: NAD(P)/FAD-dependent oxidoreductase [Polyangiales bacterium]
MEEWRHDKPRVAIIGGGFGGLAAAKALRKADAEVAIIDRHNHHLFQPLLYQVATAALSPGDIAAPIRKIVRGQANCEVLMASAKRVDLERQTVHLEDEPYGYDYLVLATGAETNYFGQDGWVEHAPGMKTIDEAINVRARFLLAFEQAELEQDEAAKVAALTFAIVGAGPTGVETAGALAEIVGSVRKDFRHIDTATSRIILLDHADRILLAFDPELSHKAQRQLESHGVEVMLQALVTDVDDKGLTAKTPDGDTRIDANNVIWAAGVKATPIGATLGVEVDRGGRVVVGDDLTVPGHPNVFVVGDLANRVDPATGRPVPGVAQGALQMGDFAGRTIANELRAIASGQPSPARGIFTYRDKGEMAIIGRNRAIAQVGKMRFAGYPAFVLWATIHIFFLIGFRRKLTVFIEWIWQYFFGTRGVRLITGRNRLPRPVKPPPDPRASRRSAGSAGAAE